MKAWIVITKKVKVKGWCTFRDDAEWLLTNSIIKNKKDAITYFLGSYPWFREKHIKTIKKIKL